MRVPLSWLRELAPLPPDETARQIAERLVAAGLEVETVEQAGAGIEGPLVVGRVLSFAEETHSNGKTIRWCSVDVGPADGSGEPRGIVCGARNFAAGDLVVVALPGAVLPVFAITARKTYGHVSDGMICSARELGLGDDHTGILVLEPGDGTPGDAAAAVLHLYDEVLDIAVTPDRGYCLSMRGVAREAATAYGVDFVDPGALVGSADLGGPEAAAGHPVRVEDPDGCPVFVARTVHGLDPSARSPRWLARRVQLCGMRPLSLMVDVTNLVMLELGQPIHGYDRERLTGDIVVRRARAGESLVTLDGTTRRLDVEDLLIADGSGPIGLAGVMGGESTELRPDTTSVVVEAATFAPVSVARTARRHKLPSEASRRFERGVDPALPRAAAARVVDLLVALGGATADPGVTVVGQPPRREPIEIEADLARRVMGAVLPTAEVRSQLAAVGCIVEDSADARDRLRVTPPTWRPDLVDPYDLVEEAGRLHGFARVPSTVPVPPPGRGLTRDQRLRRRVGQVLAGAGYVETIAPPFMGAQLLDELGIGADDQRRRAASLANPLRDEEPLLRTTLLPGLLRTLARNVGRGQADLALFETGLVFLPRDGSVAAPRPDVSRRPSDEELAMLDAALPQQPRRLAVALSGVREPRGWWGPPRPAAWADAVEAGRRVAGSLGLTLRARRTERPPWHPGRCAELVLLDGSDERVVGHGGELHPSVVAALGLPARSAALEVDLDVLIGAARDTSSSPPLSTFPVATQDVALVVGRDVPAGDVADALREGAGELIESLRLFDVYEGDQVGEGRRSLAFALRFRADDRTLTAPEVAAARDAAVAEASRRTGAELRSA